MKSPEEMARRILSKYGEDFHFNVRVFECGCEDPTCPPHALVNLLSWVPRTLEGLIRRRLEQALDGYEVEVLFGRGVGLMQ